MSDVSKAVTLDAKRYGDLVYVIGLTRHELGGSEFYAMLGGVGNAVPTVDADVAKLVYERVSAATEAELCHSLHTPVFGGLGVAFAKVAIGGHLGLDIDLSAIPVEGGMPLHAVLFSESNSRFVATVGPHSREAFEDLLGDVPHALVGTVSLDPDVTFRCAGEVVASMGVDDLARAYAEPLSRL